MAIINFANLKSNFHIAGWNTWESTQIMDAQSWDWLSSEGHSSQFYGTDFTFDGVSPATGTVTSFTFDLMNDGQTDLVITDLSFSFSLLGPLNDGSLSTSDQVADLYWNTLLSGDDTIDFGSNTTANGFSISFGADGREVGAGDGTVFGGEDSLTGDIGGGDNGMVAGDFFSISNGVSVFGGRDTISVATFGNSLVSGDTIYVNGFLSGGDDTLSFSSASPYAAISGDAVNVEESGHVVGGNDMIDAGNAGSAWGDAINVYGKLVGGADTIIVGDYVAEVAGDAAGTYLQDSVVRGGNDTIYGGDSAARISGDIFYVFNGRLIGGNDVVHGGGGIDTIYGDWQFAYPGLVAVGGNDLLFGDDGNDTIYGNGGNDVIEGGSSVDNVYGDDGDDTLVITVPSDYFAGEVYDGGTGLDTLRLSNSQPGAGQNAYDLTGADLSSIERIVLVDVVGQSNSLVLSSNQIGADLSSNVEIVGSARPDSYDKVRFVLEYETKHFSLADLVLTNFDGPQDVISIEGSSGMQSIIGSVLADVIDGKGGADTMTGLAGTDTYIVYSSGDIVVEAIAGGTDTVRTAGSYTLVANVEKLVLTGTAAVNGIGNELSNVMTGNGAANILDGKAGADTMAGLGGNDTYIVDRINDIVREKFAEGTDTVRSSVSHALSDNVERLVLVGTNAIDGTGNSSDNLITGNAAVNVIDGGNGDDVLNGNGGSDELKGGEGSDSFAFSTALGAGNIDKIVDFSVASDTLNLARNVFTGLSVGALPTYAFKDLATSAIDANDRILYNHDTGVLSYDKDGSGSAAAVQFALIQNHAILSASDFQII